MARDHVLQPKGRFLREPLQTCELLLHHAQPQNDMPQEPPLIGIVDLPFEPKLPYLPDIVQERPDQKEIPVQLRIMGGHRLHQVAHRKGVLQKASQVAVVKILGSRGQLEEGQERVIRKKPVCDVEIGHRSATVCHIGNIARWVSQVTQEVGVKLIWDPKKEEFIGNKLANSMLDRVRRKGYELPKV